MRRSIPLFVLFLACDGCHRGREFEGSYSRMAFLTVVGRWGPNGAGVAPTSCAGSMQINNETGEVIRGTFERRECAGLPRAADVHGTFSGIVLTDGTASVYFSEPPLSPDEVFRSAGGCGSDPGALGPYVGRISRSSISLQTPEFVVECCCATRPAPVGGGVIIGPSPWYFAEYRIEAVRN